MEGKYKVWMTQGQGCGKFPEAECDTLERALNKAREMFGEGGVGIQLPDGSWYQFDEEWNIQAKVTLLRMRKEGLNPKQKWLMGKWEIQLDPSEIRHFQNGAHTFEEVWKAMRIVTWQLFCDSLSWGLFDIFEYPTGIGITDEQIDQLVKMRS
jgi:hypothetical protein